MNLLASSLTNFSNSEFVFYFSYMHVNIYFDYVYLIFMPIYIWNLFLCLHIKLFADIWYKYVFSVCNWPFSFIILFYHVKVIPFFKIQTHECISFIISALRVILGNSFASPGPCNLTLCLFLVLDSLYMSLESICPVIISMDLSFSYMFPHRFERQTIVIQNLSMHLTLFCTVYAASLISAYFSVTDKLS